jgi:hypothetical protein
MQRKHRFKLTLVIRTYTYCGLTSDLA